MGERNKALTLAIELIKSGAIISIKGIGGFHLCCDALNDRSVKLLRDRKNRPLKPFAVMFKDMESIKKYVIPSIIEQAMIESKERPVTIIDKIGSTDLSKYVAPCLKKLGVFLPYSPLHHLICNVPLVMTSANLSGQAIVKDNEEALLKLYNLSDYILIHNRDIKNHCDDSVITSINQRPLLIRRSRGYAIKPIKLPIRLNKKILALGGQQKSVIALGIDDKAIASQYIGELDDISTCERFDEVVNNLMSMYNFVPELIVHDKHLGYYSTKWAKSHDIPSIGIQHHYAHALSVMADNGQSERDEIMAVTWDGTGYGDDGNIWGGEFLLSNYRGYKRIYHFDYFRLIGGDKAIKEPKRVALSLLFHIYGKDALEMNLPCIKMYAEIEKETLFKAWERGINSPLCSSVGRIFDGVASLLNIVQELGYQGQAGMMMEDMYDKMVKEYYPYEVKDGKIFWQGFIVAMIEDKSRVELRVTRFINTLAQIVIEIAKEFGKPIGLSGGVFQNKVLTEKIIELGGEQGITVLTHKNVPANDGGLFLGQLNGDI
jgi:hydrogenase maturation protein HypF